MHALEHHAAYGMRFWSALRLRVFRWHVCACVQIFVRPANRVIKHKALFVCVSGPCFLCALVYFCRRGDMLVGTNNHHPVSSRLCRVFLHARTRTHWDKSAFLHACMLACYPACCCHLLLPPATSAAAACFAKTRPEVTRVCKPFWGEILSNQTLAGLGVLWSTNLPCFTRGINPLEYHPGCFVGWRPPAVAGDLSWTWCTLWLNCPPLWIETQTHSKFRGTCPELPEESKLMTIPVKYLEQRGSFSFGFFSSSFFV